MLNKLNKRRGGFTLVEIMIVVAIIALLAAIAVPGFLRARKRSQASRIINDLRLIDSAVDQYAIENNKASGLPVPVSEWTKYLKAGTNLVPHRQRHPGQRPTVLRPWTRCQRCQRATNNALSDVAPITRSGRPTTKNLTIHSPVIGSPVAGNEL